jgi:hypothetical protein
MQMKIQHVAITLGLAIAASASAAHAQTPTPSPNSSNPSSASSPSQREATGTRSAEAPVSDSSRATQPSSPHQKDVVKGAPDGSSMSSADQAAMKECMTQQTEKNKQAPKSGQVSADNMTRMCHDQLAMRRDHSKPAPSHDATSPNPNSASPK